MATVAEILKKRREDLGLTLQEVHMSTKISTKYIRAIESGEFQTMPGDAYARGFINTYASALGLDGALLVAQYKRETGQPEDELSEQPEPDEVLTRDLDQRPRSLWVLLAVIAGLILVAFAYFGWLQSTPKSKTPKPKPLTKTKTEKKPSGSTSTTKEQPPKPIVQPTDVSVRVTIVDTDCWMEILTDGQQAFIGTMKVGESKQFKGQKSVYIYAVSGRRVSIVYNGNDLGLMNQGGEEVNRTYTPQGIQEGQAPQQ